MKSRTTTLFVAMTLFAALAIPVGLAAQQQQLQPTNPPHYKLTVLGTLGGTYAEAYGLNSGGSVAGFSFLTGDTVADAFLWQNGVITDLGTLGGPFSTGRVVNNRDTVAGFSNTSISDPNGEDVCADGSFLICLPFAWQNGVMTPLPLLGGNNGQAIGINNRGQIVGGAETPTPDPCSIFSLQVEGVIWDNGQVQALPPFPGDPDAFANAINDKGQVVGASGCVSSNITRAVLWPKGPNGGVIDLGNLGGTNGNVPSDINNRGQVVGQSDLPGDTNHHAFLWQDGVMTDLGTLPGLPTSLAFDINNQGQVVGISEDSTNTVGFFWQDGVMTDLNTLIPPGSPLFLEEPVSINDRGQIVGFGHLPDGNHRGFLLTPCHEQHGDGGDCGEDVAGTTAATQSLATANQVSPRFPGAVNPMLRRLRRSPGPWYRGLGLRAPEK